MKKIKLGWTKSALIELLAEILIGIQIEYWVKWVRERETTHTVIYRTINKRWYEIKKNKNTSYGPLEWWTKTFIIFIV